MAKRGTNLVHGGGRPRREFWVGWKPNGLGEQKPHHYRGIAKTVWENRRSLPWAWRILRKGVCDGCALGVAGFHVYLELPQIHVLECPKGLQEIGTAPQQSLVALSVLTLLLLIDALRNRSGGWFGFGTIFMALILGGAFAYGCTISTPPMVTPPREAYDKPPDGCRPANPYTKADAPQS